MNHADLLVIGGGLGGVSAALAALKAGRTVILTEQYAWLGGQLTSQAVTLDEHTWIEQFGCSASYRELRDGIRDYYRRSYPLSTSARAEPYLNPGGGLVSRVCAEPRAGLSVIEAMLAPYLSSGRLRLVQPASPAGAAQARRAKPRCCTRCCIRYLDSQRGTSEILRKCLSLGLLRSG